MTSRVVFHSDRGAPCLHCGGTITTYEAATDTGWITATCVRCSRTRRFSLTASLAAALREDTLTAAALSALDRARNARRHRRGQTT